MISFFFFNFCLYFQPKSYEFGYAVKDSASGNDFGRSETSDGDTVRGEYRVKMADGRTQMQVLIDSFKYNHYRTIDYKIIADIFLCSFETNL